MTPLRLLGAILAPYIFRPAGASGPNGADAIHVRGTRATGEAQCWAWRSLRAELARGRRDLVAVARSGLPGQPQRVALVARDHVQVEVQDGLPRLLAARVEQVHAVGVQALRDPRGHDLRRPGAGREVLRVDHEQVLRVLAWDHEQVPAGAGVDVHEGDRAVVLVDPRGRDLAGDDL